MNHRISSVAFLLVTALAPMESRADIIDVSDVDIFAFGSFKTQAQPDKVASDGKIVPRGSLTRAEVLVLADNVNGMPFPNVPTSQTEPFASSAADGNGFFGVGVNGFFFQNSLPPNALLASGTITQSFTNNSDVPLEFFLNFFIPAPTIQFFGVGDSFPENADRRRDALASAVITLQTTLTHPDGSTVEKVNFDYGIRVVREPVSGILFPFPTSDGGGLVTRFEEPDGSFGFQLPDAARTRFSIGEVGPGDRMEFTYDYFAEASTGFGETGILAAIGDPFHISAGGGRIEIQAEEAPPPSTIPEPATLATFGLGVAGLWMLAGRRRARRRHVEQRSGQ